MIFNVAYLFLVTALIISLFGIGSGVWGGQRRLPSFVDTSFHAVYAVAALTLMAAAVLWYGLLSDSFELSYVWNHSERALPTGYKFAAIWGGQAGSLLFWTVLLSVYGTIVAVAYRHKLNALMPYVNATMLTVSAFFLSLLVFAANPFDQFGVVPADGRGLNPLLQNYWMVIHPVMLYLGYVGLTVPFAFALAALASKRLDTEWVRTVRRWTLIPWMFLSAGIIMGSQWAYMELGWGGYWAWDPVENASWLPWLTGTAFLHSILIQERRGILKVWNLVMIWLTFFLVILGTFTTRSGILDSVHSFAQSDVGGYFLAFLSLIVVGFLLLLFDRLPLLKAENEIDSATSREAAFLGNNWLFAGITFATLWGTFFPMFSELITGSRISVAAPWFNKVVGPMLLLLILLMGIGPLLGWRRTSVEVMRKQFTWPLGLALLFGISFWFVSPNIFPVVGLAICLFATLSIVQEYARGIMARRSITQENVFVALVNLMRRNGQRYGGYLVHLGIVLIGVAVIGNEFYQSSTNVTLARGESADLVGYTFTYNDIETERKPNRTEIRTNITITHEGTENQIAIISPQRNLYDKTPDQPTSEVGLHMRPSEDLYVVLNGWEDEGVSATFTIYINPLTMWLWIGGIVIVLGTLVCVWPHPQRKAERTAPYSAGSASASA